MLATLGREARTHRIHLVGRQPPDVPDRDHLPPGLALLFVMYAFKLTGEEASSLTGTLTTVVGVFILITAVPSGWLADRFGRRRLVLIAGSWRQWGMFCCWSRSGCRNLAVVYAPGSSSGIATGLFMTANWALGTDLVPAGEAGRYLGISNLAGAGAGIVGAGIGGLVADAINRYFLGLGYFAVFAAYAMLFALSSVGSALGQGEWRKVDWHPCKGSTLCKDTARKEIVICWKLDVLTAAVT